MKINPHFLFIALASLTSSGHIFAQDTAFVLASSPGVGLAPYSVCAADVNGDGKVDLISANFHDDTLTVLTNDGHGGFVTASSPGVGAGPISLCAADVNGDGKVDLISANSDDNTLTVLTNDGRGDFAIASSPKVGNFPNSVCATDVNGNGKMDLICVNYSDSTLTVLTNDGHGGFVIASSPGVGSEPQCVVAADVNGNGKMDLICANYGDSTLTILTNDGHGGFVVASSPAAPGSAFVIAADMNGNGKMDLISANFGEDSVNSTLTVLTNDGSGSFVFAASPGVGVHPVSICAADVNGDGKMDLISANYGNFSDSSGSTLTVLTNNGSGGFVFATSPIVGNHAIYVCAADVNGDHQPDLISANYGDNTLTVLTNAAFSLSLEAPSLTIAYFGNQAIISWPPSVTGWTLQTNNLIATGGWNNYLGAVQNNSVTNALSKGNVFFRLIHP